ncbi:conserved Plasmodium protein, unknown function [Plasmodium ovale curtisi]|uniref:Condensin-2 complex subunit D3 n=1 Tax=Plasmodium ovale curtisi TaxID=864141 RepID=A0A1A8WFN5_PLAOA|nr:conserved Plasmodium protein, unknown function [Plasmodium ovale curtisi]
MGKSNKRKIKEHTFKKDEYESSEKKNKKSKMEKKPVNEKFPNSLNIHNNLFINFIKENKLKYEKIDNVENIYRKIKAKIISMNVSNVLMEHYDSFIYYEKNKIDFLLPELDNVINSSNIDVLKELHNLSFYPIYNKHVRRQREREREREKERALHTLWIICKLSSKTKWKKLRNCAQQSKPFKIHSLEAYDMRKCAFYIIQPCNVRVGNVSIYFFLKLSDRMIEWLVKERNEAKRDKENNENASMSYLFSLNILLTYLIYKNDDYSNYSSLIYLNIQQWMQKDKKRLQFRMFTLKGILQRFLSCSFHFNDKEIAKLRKMDIDCAASVLKNIFVALYDSQEYIDVSNLVNINDKNCIFELIKFFIELVKRPLIHSLHILCINYLIEIVRRCYDLRFCYNINVELYDIGPNVNIFVKIVNLIFAKILSILRDTKNEENTFCVEEINNINNLIILLFTNILNSCIRIIIPPILFNDKLRHSYLLANEIKNDKEGRGKDDDISYEDKVVANACNTLAKLERRKTSESNPVFSFIEIFLINNCDRYEKNGFIDLIKIVIKECRKIERKYNIMKIINDEFLLYIKGDDNKKKEDKYLDRNYLRGKKISKKRFDSCASFKVSDEYSSSVYSETEAEDDEDVEEAGTEELEGADTEGLEGADTEGLEGIVAEGLMEKTHPSELGADERDGQETVQKRTKKKVKKTVMLNKIRNTRKSILLVDGKKYYITYESVMVRYLNFILKYMSCEKYQIRIMVLDLFLALIKKKKTKKNESIFQNLFKLFLERLEDPNMIVKAKALSILVTLTNKKYHDNYIIYKFIFNKTKEKINMYKIISSNIYNHRSNIRKVSIQYIEAIFETLISRKLSYKIFLIFISNYMHSLSLDAVSSVRRQILLTVNNMFLMACEDIYIARMWLTITLSAITDIEETIKDEAISIFLNTFIKSSFQCSIFNVNEKKIKDVLQKNNLTYFKTSHRLDNTQEKNSQNTIDQFTYEKRAKREDEKVDEITIGFHLDDEKGRKMDLDKPHNREDDPSASSGEHREDFDKKHSESLNKNESIGAKERKEREEYNKNNDGVLLLINVWKIYFEEDVNNYFLTLLKMMTKYDLLNFNLIIFCLKKKKNNALEEFINLLNNFIYNLRYFSIPLWNTFIFDFVIELSKEYKHKINFENVLFLLNRCYKIYLLGTRVPAERGTSGGTIGGTSDGRKTNVEAEGGETLDVDSLLNNQVRRNVILIDYILTEEDLIYEKNQCPNGILKNIMLKLFTIIYNLLDNMNELNEEFLQKMEYTIFNFTCPLCFIYITLNILIKKKKNVNEFMDKLKTKIWFYFENVDSIPHNNALCNILITFIFLIKQFNKSDPSFLTAAGLKMGKLYESAASDEHDDMNSGGRENWGNVMARNCLYLTQCVLLIEGVGTSRNELFSNFERDLKNSNTSMNILNNLIILTYYMIINFGSSCNKFVFILLRFFKHENSFIRYLSFYTLSKLISEDYVKFSNQFFFGFLYLLADKNEMIRKHSLSVFKHILLIYNKTNLINYIIEFIFVLNNFYNFKMSKHLIHIGNHFEIKNREDRHIIYSFLLQNLTNSEKFSLQQKLINDYLIQYVYNYDNYYFSDDNLNEKKNNKGNIIPLNDEENEGCVLLDVLHILCSRLMKIKIKKDFAKLEEKNKNIKIKNVENSVKVLNDLMKNILKKNTLPILLSLRMIMLKTKSFFFKYVNNLIIYLCLDYRDSLDDLIPEAHVKNEILNDCHSFLYVDVIHTYSDQTDFFSKNGKSNVDVNFFELSEVQAADQAVLQYRERDGEKQRGGDIDKQMDFSYNNDNSSSDYDDVSNVLHGIQDGNSKSSKKKKKKKRSKK